ncbi:type VI secretion system-associated protein TagF [Chelativorans sp. AA-79]|uniref:type VI secretion system-associated protein TagF n=1 Tax=Chelativorans sp. AA-79 TaxID=3028735 RepID=UPI0023F7291E|nr:type VI secretion system-associated protein TagF [Chelativorans sp. AA-79]WEX08248.1 type VI secretion system-associated protein TagF [Chelativorans sp. AA-79]
MRQGQTKGATKEEPDLIGFFGKVPTHGDFLSEGFGPALREALDGWIQAGLQSSEQVFGRQWRDMFHANTPWRFVVQSGLWGPATVAGVMLPSRDRVGRSFPLIVAAQLSSYSGAARWLCYDRTWFLAAEALAETSRAKDFDLAGLSAGLKRLRLPEAKALVSLPGEERDGNGRGVSIWWMVDAHTRQVSGFKTVGQPRESDFPRLLEHATGRIDGDETRQPGDVSARQEPRSAEAPSSRELVIERGYATHPGTRLSINGDALLLSDVPRLFAIADGVGDGMADANAAKAAVNALTDATPQETLSALVQEVKGKLGRAHGLLRALPVPDQRGEGPKASVIVLAIMGDAFAVIWAGDARCYLVRDRMMRCLTRDHIEIGLRRRLSRCIGGDGPLAPEIVSDTLQDGDQLLLCSAPLPRVLGEHAIATMLLDLPAHELPAALVQEALIVNTRDNVSAILVGASQR